MINRSSPNVPALSTIWFSISVSQTHSWVTGTLLFCDDFYGPGLSMTSSWYWHERSLPPWWPPVYNSYHPATLAWPTPWHLSLGTNPCLIKLVHLSFTTPPPQGPFPHHIPVGSAVVLTCPAVQPKLRDNWSGGGWYAFLHTASPGATISNLVHVSEHVLNFMRCWLNPRPAGWIGRASQRK